MTSAHNRLNSPDDNWDIVIKSRFLTRWGIVLAVSTVLVHIAVAYLLMYNVESLGVFVGRIDQMAFVILGLIFAGLFLTGTRPRLRANSHGVEVRGFFATNMVPWPEVYGLAFPGRARCARLELPQYEYLPVWALNRWDSRELPGALRQYVAVQDRYIAEE